MANSSIDLVSLDVPALEESLRQYMRGVPMFRDYDFEGSNLSALIRLLALNTHKNAFYLNLVHAEGFLDSAQTRGSVISHAKELNYVPRSARSAEARVTVTFNGTNSTYLLEKGRTFSSIIKNRGLVFSIPDTTLLTSTNGYFQLETSLYEGRFVKDTFVMDQADETQRFILSNPDVDTRSLTVVVYQDGEVVGHPYIPSTTLLDVVETSNVYFLQASELGRYEVVFGDGVIGRRPSDGSSVVLDYRVTVGDQGNGARVFTRDFEIGEGVTNVRVGTMHDSRDGAVAESIESIKYYAPRHFQVQERAVTATDYTVLLKTNFPEIRAVSAYGGEDAVPPRYGNVIIAVDVADVDGLPASKRDEYYDFLRRRTGLTVQPIFIEPNFTYVSITSEVDYNLNVTTMSPENISALVRASILEWTDENLNDFESTLRYSRLVSLIDQAQASIVGNRTEVEVYKKVELQKRRSQSLEVGFAMPLFDGYPETGSAFPVGDLRTIRSSQFEVAGETRHLTDDGSGGVWVATDRGQTSVMLQRVGDVDYASGRVSINNLYVDTYPGAYVLVYARPASLDVSTRQDTILAVEADEVRVDVKTVRE